METEMLNLLLNALVALVAVGLIPWARSVYATLKELTKEIHSLNVGHATLSTTVANLKWMDDFASDQRKKNEELTERLHRMELEFRDLKNRENP